MFIHDQLEFFLSPK